MLKVNQRAKEELKRILSTEGDNPQAGVRLFASGQDNFGLGLDVEKPGDQVVKHEGLKVLLVDNELAPRLDGYTLDFEGKKEFVMAKGPLSGFNTSMVTLNLDERKHKKISVKNT